MLKRIRAFALIGLTLAVTLPGSAAAESGSSESLSAGGTHSCALAGDGELRCWGGASQGSTGIPGGTFVAVSAGGAHSCAIRADRGLACWGDNSRGQLDGIPAGEFIAVSAGGAHSCAIRADGWLACWGDGSLGQLTGIPAGEFIAVSAGGAHSCAIRADGNLACWGDDSSGQVSDAPGGRQLVADAAAPSQLQARHSGLRSTEFHTVSAGAAHTCAIRADGRLECWGDDSSSQVSHSPGGRLRAVSAGDAHGCAIADGGELECWGDGGAGRLDFPGGEFRSVSAGAAHTCAVAANGEPICWGANDRGQTQPRIAGARPADAVRGEPYSHRFATTPQEPPPAFHLSGGQLPDGLSLAGDGLLSGTPASAGAFSFTVSAANGTTPDANRKVRIEVTEPAGDPGLPPPTAGETFNLERVDGTISRKCASEGAFTKVPKAEQVEVGCLIDTRHGTASLTVSKGTGGATQSGYFWGGLFVADQETGDEKEAVLTLDGGLRCEKRTTTGGRVMLARKRRGGRKLWGSGSGKFKTVGSHGAATVRGTTWLVVDRCDGSSLFKVKEGTVRVRDFVTGKTIVLRAGQRYITKLARSRLPIGRRR